MFQPNRLFTRMTTSVVRTANTVSCAALVLCLTACGDDAGAAKADPNAQEPKAGSAAMSGAGASGQTAGAGGKSGGDSSDAGSTAGSGGRAAADGGKGGAGAAGSKAGGAGRAGAGGTAEAGQGGSGGTGGSKSEAGAGGSAEPPALTDQRVAEIARSLAEAVCQALEQCVGSAKLTMLTAREDCVERYSAGFQQDDFGTLATSVEAGWIKLDESKLNDCYADTRALGCKVQADRLPTSCQEAIAAQRHAGDACAIDADCAVGTYCPIDASCPRNCQAAVDKGANCTRDAECKVGSICSAGKCTVPSDVGAPCAGNSGGVCELGDSCVGSDDTNPGTCQTNASVQVGELDQPCTPGMTLCKEGLSCAYDGAAFFCVGPVASGAACRLALPSQCPVDTYCSAADLTQTGSCLALPTEGKTCVLNNACAAGHVCVTQGGKNTCRELGDLGDACAADALCRSGACVDGACAIRPRCE